MNGMQEHARPVIAPPEEDPNAVAVACNSPPCFMHELDPSYLGYLSHDEVRGLLEALHAAKWSGTVLEAAWLRAMLRRHLAGLGAARRAGTRHPGGGAATGDDLAAGPADAGQDGLARRLREALPRLADDAVRRDLAEVLRMMERDLRWRCGRAGEGQDMRGWDDVRIWRKAQRASLLARRLCVARDEREGWSAAITARLGSLPALDGPVGTLGFYWPFKGEYDPRPLARSLHARGARLALPVVVERGRPLAFREWWPGMRMRPGVWDIPVPDEGDWVRPEALLVPLLGFDPQGYRLGYGGGYYDRTLAALPARPLAVGIGFEAGRLETIHPQPHDVPMDLIVTERQSAHAPQGARRDAAPRAATGSGGQECGEGRR